VHPSLYPALILLSRLRPSLAAAGEAGEEGLSPAALVPSIMGCCAARPLAVRRLASRALPPLLSAGDVVPVLRQLAEQLLGLGPGEGRARLGANEAHGALLQLQALLHSLRAGPGAPQELAELLPRLQRLAWLAGARCRCAVLRVAFLELCALALDMAAGQLAAGQLAQPAADQLAQPAAGGGGEGGAGGGAAAADAGAADERRQQQGRRGEGPPGCRAALGGGAAALAEALAATCAHELARPGGGTAGGGGSADALNPQHAVWLKHLSRLWLCQALLAASAPAAPVAAGAGGAGLCAAAMQRLRQCLASASYDVRAAAVKGLLELLARLAAAGGQLAAAGRQLQDEAAALVWRHIHNEPCHKVGRLLRRGPLLRRG
jgi:hypothetical protein